MEPSEKAEEVLEALWIHTEDTRENSTSLDSLGAEDKESIEQLLKAGYIALDKDRVRLTNEEQPFARNVVTEDTAWPSAYWLMFWAPEID